MAADVAGFSTLVEREETGTLQELAGRRQIFDAAVEAYGGRIANTAGDGVIAEFASAIDAVRCAIEIQSKLAERASVIHFRIGIHIGDVVPNGNDVLGDTVNIAARLQSLAEPGSICISKDVYSQVRKVLALAVTDLHPQPVKGLSDPVHGFRIDGFNEKRENGPEQPPAVPSKPSIAVLPFSNMSDDSEHDYFCDGVVEDIITALSRVRSFFVIARNSSFAYKGRAVDIRQVGRELGVRYVLEGSVRKSANRLRITGQLIEAESGRHIWADRFDGELNDIFEFQDRITESVVGALEPSIRWAEIERARQKRPENLDAYDLVMRAVPGVWSLERAANLIAERTLHEALALDPGYATALALSAWCRAQRAVYLWSADSAEDCARAVQLATDAARLAPDDPFTLTVLGATLTHAKKLEQAAIHLSKALALDPNSAWAWNRSGWLQAYRGDGLTGIEHQQRALRLSPLDPMAFNFYMGMGGGHFAAGNYETAATWFEKGLDASPTSVWMYRGLAVSQALAGRMDDARASLAKLLAAYPGLTVRQVRDAMPWAPEPMERFCTGLSLAGLPD
jgi:adenylate cyclase